MAPTAVSIPTADPMTTTTTKKMPTSSLTESAITNAPSHSNQDDLEEEQISTEVTALRTALVSETTPLAVRFRALFSLKHHAAQHPPTPLTLPAIQAIAAAFGSPSALLKHELAYCLGQSGNDAAAPYLQVLVKDRAEDAMCRHEAAEALGALGDAGSLQLLKERWSDESEVEVVRETCEIAVGRIEWLHSERRRDEKIRASDFASVDPAPPEAVREEEKGQSQNGSSTRTNSSTTRTQTGNESGKVTMATIDELKGRLLDVKLGLFDRYRAMFALRDLASPPDLPTAEPAVLALASGLKDKSALFRHEVAFVFGQLSHPASIPALKETLALKEEESMVRHEAAEALGSLGDEDGVEDFLKRFIDDPEQVVRDSVIVALDMAEFERKGELEYATLPSDPAIDGFSPMVRSGVV